MKDNTNKKKLALFDFCDTIVGFQSAKRYVRYCVKNYPSRSIRIRHICFTILRKLYFVRIFELLFPQKNIEKRLLLWQIKNTSYQVLEAAAEGFYKNEIVPKLIPETIKELNKRIHDGYEIAIVSGGYDIYIRHFAINHNVPVSNIIANRLIFKDGLFTGKFDIDCMGDTKVKMLDMRYNKAEYEIVAYTDSCSDLPMLKWANNGYIIYQKPLWIKNNHYQMILV